MKPVIEFDGVRVFHGDCRDVLRKLPDNSVDCVVTDPPYELGFMGKKWDSTGIAYDVTVWQECLRVLKPGGHILAFGGSRTWHRLAVAIEDAGFEIRDSIAWMYGSGFPKSLDVSKAIDKKAGAEREKIRHIPRAETSGTMMGSSESRPWIEKSREQGFYEADGPDAITPEAQKWQGWGTALKPAFEPIVVGRKPLVGTVAENVLQWGTGGLNIDGSRIGSEGGGTHCDKRDENGKCLGHENAGRSTSGQTVHAEQGLVQGRWPANVILDEYTAELLDQQSGVSVSRPVESGGYLGNSLAVGGSRVKAYGSAHDDKGGASRFFYVAKASKRDRNEGLEELPDIHPSAVTGRKVGSAGAQNGGYAGMTETPRKNIHPTVKPTALMRYLIKLVTPPGGTVLDPFTGSGSTGKAAILDGFQFVGMELTEDYLPIIEGRLRWAMENRDEGTLF